MNLTRYVYLGPQSAVCLRVEGSTDLLDVQLLHNQVVELPAEHEYTRVLLALKHLVLVPTETGHQPVQSSAPGPDLVAGADAVPATVKKGGKS